jgi:glycosyltransferase involved in cell wall biosynthesis
VRILHVIYDDIGNPWLGGGGAVRTLEIYSRIAARGHRTLVLCGRYPGATLRETRRGVRYRRVGVSGSYVMSRLSFMLGAARLIKRGGYDIVIEDVSPYSPVAAPLWKPASVPAVASVQNLSGQFALDKYGWLGRGPRWVEGPLLRLFDRFVAVSPGIAEQLRARTGREPSVCVVPNGVDPHFFGPMAAEPSRGIGAPYIVSLGRIDVYQKGLDRLIRAFDLFARRMNGVELVIAGAGTPRQEAELARLVAQAEHSAHIRVIGQVDTAGAAALMRGAMLLAMPSRYEAWPLTALEAGASRLTVVGSDIVGVRDAAPPYPRGHGLLVPDGDELALADAFAKLATNRNLREEIGERGRDWAARFTWDAVAEEQLSFFEELVGANGA